MIKRKTTTWTTELGVSSDDLDFHPDAVKSLFLNTLLQAVKDADSLGHEGRLAEINKDMSPGVQLEKKRRLIRWLDSIRCEFWVEWIDLPIEKVEETVLAILHGQRRPLEQKALRKIREAKRSQTSRKLYRRR